MENIFNGIEGVCVFLDDLLITGPSDNEQFSRLRVVLDKLNLLGLKIKANKCNFFANSVSYLGHIVDAEGLRVSKEKIRAIQNVKRPSNVTESKSFLGMVNYYAKYIKNLSEIVHPLYQLLRVDSPWDWSYMSAITLSKL